MMQNKVFLSFKQARIPALSSLSPRTSPHIKWISISHSRAVPAPVQARKSRSRSPSTDEPPHELHHMEMAEKNEIARDRFHKDYDELSTNEKRAVGGVHGGNARKKELEEAKGGDTHAAYADLRNQKKKDAEEREK